LYRELNKTNSYPKNDKNIQKIIHKLNWDYIISSDEIIAVFRKEKEMAGHWDFEHLFIRALEKLSWYELIDLIGIDTIRCSLTPSIINQLRFPEQKLKYERIRKILQGETLSFAKWGVESRCRFKDTLFSLRWYRTEQILL